MSKKNIVIMGGGNGSATSINALKPYVDKFELSCVVSMSDSGGANGRLRKKFDMLPPADLLRAMLAMSKHDYRVLKEIFYKNRPSGVNEEFDGYYLGSLFIFFAQRLDNSFMETIDAFHQMLDTVGQVYPVTLEQSDLCVELTNGEIIIGEGEVDRPTHDRAHTISRAWLQPTPMIYEGAKKVIEEADIILFGPGSLYTSIVTNLAVEGMMKGALRNTKAQFVYILGNGYEADGEAGPTTMSGFVKALESFLPRTLDMVVYNNHVLSKKEEAYYKKRNWECFEQDVENIHDCNIVAGDFEKKGGGLDPKKLGEILMKEYNS